MYDDYDEDRIRAANLDKADDGFELCPECDGTGTQMVARLYPSGHTECTEYCDMCGGDGQIELTAPTKPGINDEVAPELMCKRVSEW